ncbi:MAG: YlxM family DNA-binding protein [Turicibacter sp.]|nr:YlxM family DNA-binding protein [Turicibacter sp.]
MIEKVTLMNSLYDAYGLLLTPKQKNYFELYYQEDWSLNEIAQQFAISRPAVFDNIKRTENLLLDYEEKLSLVKKQQQRLHLLDCLKTLSNQGDILAKIQKIIALEGLDEGLMEE